MSDENTDYLREYAWNWFSYHAEQRTSMFNYSLAAASLLAAGFGATIEKLPFVAAAIGMVGALVTWSFFLIDGRNDKLVRRGERVLKALEQSAFPDITAAPKGGADHPMPGGILIVNEEGVRTDHKDGVLVQYFRGTHRIHLRLIEFLFFVAFLVGAFTAIWMPNAFQLKDPSVAEDVRLLSGQVEHLNASLKVLADKMVTAPVLPSSDSAVAVPHVTSLSAPRGNRNARP